MNFFATTPKGLELLLVEELRALGAEFASEKLAGVEFKGDLKVAYKACLWSRLANRILMPIALVPASTPEELYAGVQTIQWDEHINPEGTIHINFVSSQSEITHTLFGSQKVKDAIVDQIREKYNTRPSVAKENPDVSVHIYLYRNMASISIDLSGESLHKRGIRVEHGPAPLKENLAAAILLRSGWKAVSAAGGMLFDPMCGSGTFLIEAAQMAANIAPGLSRKYFGFLGWKKHNAPLWKELVTEAKEQQDLENIPPIIGYDSDPNAIKIAFANIERASMLGKIHVEKREFSDFTPIDNVEPGLIVINPPYGERLGEISELKSLYEMIGAKFKSDFLGWKAAIFTGNPDLGKVMGIRARKHYALFNGAIPCQLLLFDITPDWFIDRSSNAANERRIRVAQRDFNDKDMHAVQMFINRLQKNMKHIRRWSERENITCYRMYDADLPEYAVSVDRYEDRIVVKEYPAPKSIDKMKSERRLQQVLAVLPEVLEVPSKNIYMLATVPDKDAQQLNPDSFQHVTEGPLKFYINLRPDYVETGLLLHQRLYRRYVESISTGKNILNLFSRSGTTIVSAALGGAASTVNVDDSAFYLEWTKQNLALNNLAGVQHKFFHADPMEWIYGHKIRYDLILVELPEKAHRLREEYQPFIEHVIRLLRPEGTLLVSSRDLRFKLEIQSSESITVKEIGSQFISPDFSGEIRRPCYWKITI